MKNKSSLFIGSAVLLIGLFAAAAVYYQKQEKAKLDFLAGENSEVFVRDHSPRYGNKDAKVILTEFLDPECESCRSFYPVVKEMIQEFEGQVQLVVRYAPFHKNSQIAVRALEAARIQGKYWQALELLFYFQPQWGDHHNPKPELIFQYLPQLDLDMEKLKEDMKSPDIAKMMDQDMKDLRTLNVRGTPTFFVNGKALNDFSVDGIRNLLQEEVDRVYP